MDVIDIDFNKHSLLCGNVQMGKSAKIIKIAFEAYENGYSVLIVLNNSTFDTLQLEQRVKNFLYQNEIDDNPFVFLRGAEKQFIYHFEKKKKRIYVTIGHYSKLENFKKYYNGTKLYIIFDESDLFSMPDKRIEDKEISQAIENSFTLIKMSTGTLRVSATPHSHWIGVEALPVLCKNVFKIKESRDYISYGHPLFETRLTDLFYVDNRSRKINGQYETELLRILDEIKDTFEFPITYINTSNIRLCHQQVAEIIRHHYPLTLIIVINNSKVNIIEPDIFFVDYKKQESIQKMMFYIQTEMDNGLFDSIVLIGGKQVCRGISLRSEIYGTFDDVSEIIYVNSMIYTCVEEKPTDDMIQTGLRLSGIFPKMKEKLVLYSTKTVLDNIHKQLEWSKQILEACEKNPKKWTIEVVPPVEGSLNRPYSTSKNDFAWKRMGNLKFATKESYSANDEDLESKFKEWCKPGNVTIIALFMRNLNPSKMYTRTEILDLSKKCGSSTPLSHIQNCTTISNDTSHSYGLILDKICDTYILRAELRSLFSKYFE